MPCGGVTAASCSSLSPCRSGDDAARAHADSLKRPAGGAENIFLWNHASIVESSMGLALLGQGRAAIALRSMCDIPTPRKSI